MLSELPDGLPRIDGAKKHYSVGELALLNCTSAKSKPAPKLTWYINGHPVSLYYVIPSNINLYYIISYKNSLYYAIPSSMSLCCMLFYAQNL